VPVLHFHGSHDPLVPVGGNPLLGFKKARRAKQTPATAATAGIAPSHLLS